MLLKSFVYCLLVFRENAVKFRRENIEKQSREALFSGLHQKYVFFTFKQMSLHTFGQQKNTCAYEKLTAMRLCFLATVLPILLVSRQIWLFFLFFEPKKLKINKLRTKFKRKQ